MTVPDVATFCSSHRRAVATTARRVPMEHPTGPHRTHDGFNAYYAAMKAVNPSIQVCAADTDQNFITDMGSAFPYDCLQYHPYEQNTDTTGNIASFENTVMAAPRSENTTAQMWQSAMRSVAGHAIPLDLSEYGSLLNDTPDPGLVPYYYDSLDEALLNASQLAFWIKLGGINVADRQVLTGEQPAAANVAAGLPGAAPFATTGAIVTPLAGKCSRNHRRCQACKYPDPNTMKRSAPKRIVVRSPISRPLRDSIGVSRTRPTPGSFAASRRSR